MMDVNQGQDNGNSKLTPEKVKKIRYDRERNPKVYSYTRLARNYGVSFSCIRDIITGRTWNHV